MRELSDFRFKSGGFGVANIKKLAEILGDTDFEEYFEDEFGGRLPSGNWVCVYCGAGGGYLVALQDPAITVELGWMDRRDWATLSQRAVKEVLNGMS